MKKTFSLFFRLTQIGVIFFAVFITIVRLSSLSINGYEPHVESWFKEQGVNVEINALFLRIDGFTPELHVNGLLIKDANQKPLITLNTATLYLNVFQSIFKQHLIIEKADFYLNKAVIDSALFNQDKDDKQLFLIPPDVIQSLLALKHFTLSINQLDYVDHNQNTHSIYNSKIFLLDDNDKKQVNFSSSLFQQTTNLLTGQVLINPEKFLAQGVLSGEGFVALNTPSLKNANISKYWPMQGGIEWTNWIKFDGLDGQVISKVKVKNLRANIENKRHYLDMDSILLSQFDNKLLSITMDNNLFKLNKIELSSIDLNTEIQTDLSDAFVQLEHLNINALSKLLPTIPSLNEYSELVSQLKPKGLINELFIQIPKLNNIQQAQVAILAEHIQWQANDAIPAVNNINVDMVANQDHFNAQVTSDSLELLLGTLYKHPFKVDHLVATINGQIDEQVTLLDFPSIKIKRNKADVAGRAQLVFEERNSPYMFVRLKGHKASIKTVEPFLPQKLMDDDVLNWVVNSVQQANVNTADVMYSGRLENDVNFDAKNNGVFIAALNIDDVDLMYDKNWPNVKAKQANVIFKNYQLDVNSQLGHSLDVVATDISFTINDLSDAKAKLTLKVNKELQKQWAFLAATPIQDYIPYFSDVSGIKGSANTKVDVKFPLANLTSKDILFNVNLNTQQAGFSMNNLGVLLSDLSSDINIDQTGLTINPTKAKWYDQTISLNAKTNDIGAILFDIKASELDIHSLLNNLPSETKKHFSGKSSWDIAMQINQSVINQPMVTISANSSLKGTRIHLPSPFLFDDKDEDPFNVQVDIYADNHIDVSMSLEQCFDTFTRLDKVENQYTLVGANVLFGERKASKELKGNISIGGEIDEVNLDHWRAYLESDENNKNPNILKNIKKINIMVKQIIAYGIEAKDTQLKINEVAGGLNGSITSSVAVGDFFIPVLSEKKDPIDLNMDFIDIKLKENAGDIEEIEYKTDLIPNIFLKSKRLAINDKKFSDVSLILESHQKHLFELKELSLTHNKIKLNATGDWLHDINNDEHNSKISIRIEGKKLGESLYQLGFGDAIENGEVKASGDLTWKRPFWSLDLDDAIGHVKLSLVDGYFKDVEPGGGRFVGLLSLSALPRRLILDFSDFFKKGLEFDKVKGDFSIHDGSMWTKNLKMKGSVADVKIKGRTGLKTKDYDQVMIVTPQVRDALPVLASLISGSSVGWAMLLLQKVFEDPIDESVSIKYKITGDWENPKIEVVEKPKPKESDIEDVNEN